MVDLQYKDSSAFQYVQSKGWNWKHSGDNQIELESCPFCHKTDYGHFYLQVHNITDGAANRDGLWMCHRCGKSGNLFSLKKEMNDVIPGVQDTQSWAKTGEKQEPLINHEQAHAALFEEEATEALQYLQGRGWSEDIIKKQKIGYVSKRYFRETVTEVPAIVYPYLTNGNCVFWHYRTIPSKPKAFSSPKGWDAPLYNADVIQQGTEEIIVVEGEANTITLLDKGIENVVGVPGANFKKAEWINVLDNIYNEETKKPKICILYDKDKVGQRAAQAVASRIGIDRCWKVDLPEFTFEKDGKTCVGKDVNEWFQHGGGTLEALRELIDSAPEFPIAGVLVDKDALTELEDDLSDKQSLKPAYGTPWEPLNRLVGFEEGDVIDIVAPEKIGKTTFAMNLMEHAVKPQIVQEDGKGKFVPGEDGIIICLEMSNARLVRKWVSHLTQFDDSLPKNDEQAIEKLAGLKKAIQGAKAVATQEGRGNLYFCGQPVISDVEEAYKLITDVIRRYGVKWVMFDNLQRLCDLTLKEQRHRTIHLSQISKRFATIAGDYKIKFIRILQPKRIDKHEILSTDDVDGSSQIAKDCDCMITLHRNRLGEMDKKSFEIQGFVESEQSFDSKMKVTVGLSRYSSGGFTTLEFDGACSTVREYNVAVKQTMKPKEPVTPYNSDSIPTEDKSPTPL